MTDEQALARFFAKRADRLSSWGEECKKPATMSELVSTWIAYWSTGSRTAKDDWRWAADCVHDLVDDDADLGLEFVLAVLATDPRNRKMIGVLAAGPLEDLLADHGPAIIERVEELARRSPPFRDLLGGVWQNAMPEEIWQRVLKAAPTRW